MSPDLICRPSVAPTPPRRRGAGVAGWIIPSAALILMPKCPMCVAMYVALFTGAFLVFSTQSLSVLRRRRSLALLRALGATQSDVSRMVLLNQDHPLFARLLMTNRLAGTSFHHFDVNSGFAEGVCARIDRVG